MKDLTGRLLRFRNRQLSNDRLKPVLHLGLRRFSDLHWEIMQMTEPSVDVCGSMHEFWRKEIVSTFVKGDTLRILGYEVRVL